MLKKILIKKRSKGNFLRRNLKKKIFIVNVIVSKSSLMHKAERPSNYFFQVFHTLSG